VAPVEPELPDDPPHWWSEPLGPYDDSRPPPPPGAPDSPPLRQCWPPREPLEWWPPCPPPEPQAIAAGTPATPRTRTAAVLTRTSCAFTVVPPDTWRRRGRRPRGLHRQVGAKGQPPTARWPPSSPETGNRPRQRESSQGHPRRPTARSLDPW